MNEQKSFTISPPGFFRYLPALTSICLYGLALYLGERQYGYNFFYNSISEVIYFTGRFGGILFNSAFIIKGLIDLGFIWYLKRVYGFRIFSFPMVIWIIPVISCIMLGFYPTGEQVTLHLLWGSYIFAFCLVAQLYYANLTRSRKFIWLTAGIIILQLSILAICFIDTGRVTALCEIFFSVLSLFWLVVFNQKYLPRI